MEGTARVDDLYFSSFPSIISSTSDCLSSEMFEV